MKLNDAVFGALLLVLGVTLLLTIRAYPQMPGQNVGPALFPGLIASGLVVCALLLIVGGVRRHAQSPWFEGLPWLGSRRHGLAVVAVGRAVPAPLPLGA